MFGRPPAAGIAPVVSGTVHPDMLRRAAQAQYPQSFGLDSFGTAPLATRQQAGAPGVSETRPNRQVRPAASQWAQPSSRLHRRFTALAAVRRQTTQLLNFGAMTLPCLRNRCGALRGLRTVLPHFGNRASVPGPSPGYAESFATAPMDARAQQQYADSFAAAPLDAGTLGPGGYAESFNTAPPTGTDSATEVGNVLAALLFSKNSVNKCRGRVSGAVVCAACSPRVSQLPYLPCESEANNGNPHCTTTQGLRSGQQLQRSCFACSHPFSSAAHAVARHQSVCHSLSSPSWNPKPQPLIKS